MSPGQWRGHHDLAVPLSPRPWSPGGSPSPPRDARMLRARRSAGPRCDIDCGDTTGHGGGRAGDRRLEHGWVHPGAPGHDEAGLGSSRCTGTGESPGASAIPAAAGCQCRPDAGSGERSRKRKILGLGDLGRAGRAQVLRDGASGWRGTPREPRSRGMEHRSRETAAAGKRLRGSTADQSCLVTDSSIYRPCPTPLPPELSPPLCLDTLSLCLIK